jgi:prevent-host-death family protein
MYALEFSRRCNVPRTVSATEAQNNFGAMLAWVETDRDGVIVQRHGQPVAAVIAYAEYEEWQRLRLREHRQQILQELRALREEVQRANPTTDMAELYREAGFAEQVIKETLELDQYNRSGEDE